MSLSYQKANRLLQDKQSTLLLSIPEKYHSKISRIISAEHVLTMLEEGHEAETYEYEINKILKLL